MAKAVQVTSHISSTANDLLTPTFTVQRKELADYYKKKIDELD
jgi:hypothetical protein